MNVYANRQMAALRNTPKLFFDIKARGPAKNKTDLTLECQVKGRKDSLKYNNNGNN
jgi:hypothetical protein